MILRIRILVSKKIWHLATPDLFNRGRKIVYIYIFMPADGFLSIAGAGVLMDKGVAIA
jgi:hypothetical protein